MEIRCHHSPLGTGLYLTFSREYGNMLYGDDIGVTFPCCLLG